MNGTMLQAHCPRGLCDTTRDGASAGRAARRPAIRTAADSMAVRFRHRGEPHHLPGTCRRRTLPERRGFGSGIDAGGSESHGSEGLVPAEAFSPNRCSSQAASAPLECDRPSERPRTTADSGRRRSSRVGTLRSASTPPRCRSHRRARAGRSRGWGSAGPCGSQSPTESSRVRPQRT